MAVIALASASGSPGVTTTALGLALLWPRPVLLVEADPTGGSGLLAGYFRGTREYEAGLIELALTASSIHDGLAEVSQRIEGTTVSFVAGTRSHTQAPALRDLWQPLAAELAELEGTGQDVIVDAGRLGLVGAPEPLLTNADLTLLVTRTTLPAISAVRSWADSIQRGTFDWQKSGVVVVGEGQPYKASEVGGVLGTHTLAEGDLAMAREAVEVAHHAAPYDEITNLDLVAVASAEGHEELAQQFLNDRIYNRSDDDLGPVELPPRTQDMTSKLSQNGSLPSGNRPLPAPRKE